MKIVTSHVYPPIPTRDHDWCAHYEGEEEAGGYGWGPTEAKAIADFNQNHRDDHDDRLGIDPLMTALRELNKAARAALMAGRDTTKYPMLNRQMLRQIVTMTDALMEAGTERTAELEGE